MKKTARVRLIEERKQRRWSQQEVATRLGTTRPNVSRWEAGLTTPGPYFRAKLCELFGKSAQELGLLERNSSSLPTIEKDIETTERPDSTAEALPALWTVPYGRNPQFTGRDAFLAQLEQHFFPQAGAGAAFPACAALTQPQAVKGLGGIGKTQIALEYAYRAREQDRYQHVLWINAASEEAILTSFVTLAEALPAFPAREETDQRKLAQAIKRWLEQCLQPWLLIFDNADEVSLLRPYLPKQGHGSVLLTTRSHAVGSLAASLEVENMGLVEGTMFLLRRAQRQEVSDEERNEATNVVIALAGFPLALDQAGAYIEETGCSFADYLETYQEHRQALLARRGRQATDYPDSVATTWSLSFQKVTERNPAAAELLQLCAFLAPDAIPEELLIQGATFWPASLQQAVGERLSFQQMLEDLLRFSLVKRRGEERLFSLHRLVQVVQRDSITAEEQRQWAERVVRATNTTFPETVEMATWSLCRRFLSQAQVCSGLIQSFAFVFAEAASLLFRTASYLHDYSLNEQAEPLYQHAIHIWEQTLGPEHSEVAHALNGQAHLYKEQGKYAEAGPLYLRAISIREQQLGPEHPLVATSLNGLAELYRVQGRYEEAEPLFQRALHIWEQQPGPDHVEVSYPLNGLAMLYFEQGKYAEAEPLYLRSLHIRERQLGPNHLRVSHLLNNLAILYRERGEYAKAEPLYFRALHIREQMGPDHLEVSYPLNNLAEIYREQRRYVEAEPLFQRALRIREQWLGPEHLRVSYPLTNLAELYREQGKYAEAEPLFQRALHIREQQLGSEHPYVAHPLNGLANLYKMQEKGAEAEPLYQRALSIREHALGENHLETAETLYDFATFQETQGKYQEAASLYQRALVIRERILGGEHPKTMETRKSLDAAMASLERMEEGVGCIGAQTALVGAEEMEKSTDRDGKYHSDLPCCPSCQNNNTVVKSGINRSGSLRFRCHGCHRYFTPQQASRRGVSALKEQAVLLAKQGKSYRFIARQLGVSHPTIRAWVTARNIK